MANLKELERKLKEITTDSGDSVEHRIERVIALRDDLPDADKEQTLEEDALCYSLLIEMLDCEHANLSNAFDLLQLYALLAETYEELNRGLEVKKIAFKVRDIIRCDEAPWKAIEETVPRVIDAVNETIYNHAAYDLTLMFLRMAFKEGRLDENLKGRARRLLKLHILMDDSYEYNSFFSKELQDAIAALFTPQELMKIIIDPSIGHLRCDPVEYTYRWEQIYPEVQRRLDDRFANAPRHMGFCFKYWEAKRSLLRDEYGIEWRSPSQMNPRVMFD